MTTEARIRYSARPDVSPAAERAALGAIYRLVLNASAKKRAAGDDGGADAGKEKIDSDETGIQQRG
jgi:hypothetical protein